MDHTDDGRPIKMITLIDKYTRECLAIHVARRIRGRDVIDVLADVMQRRGVPTHIRSDNVLSSQSSSIVSDEHPVRGAAMHCAA